MIKYIQDKPYEIILIACILVACIYLFKIILTKVPVQTFQDSDETPRCATAPLPKETNLQNIIDSTYSAYYNDDDFIPPSALPSRYDMPIKAKDVEKTIASLKSRADDIQEAIRCLEKLKSMHLCSK